MRLAGRACHGARDVLNRMRVRWCAWAVLNLANHIKKNTRVLNKSAWAAPNLYPAPEVYARPQWRAFVGATEHQRAPQSTTKEKASQSTTKRIGVKESTAKPHMAPSCSWNAFLQLVFLQGNTYTHAGAFLQASSWNAFLELVFLQGIEKNVQHRAFPRGPPPQYYLGPLLPNLAVRVGSGGFSRV